MIDKVLNHKVVDGKTLFHIKWKDASEGEAWIDETKFNTKECINKYWKSKFNIAPRRVERPRKVTVNYLLLLLFALLLRLIEADVEKGPFDFCNNDMKSLEFDDMCSSLNKNNDTYIDDYLVHFLKSNGMPTIGLNNQFAHELLMLSKMQHQVVGTGYECFKSRVTKSFTMTASSDKIEGAITEEWISLSYLECWEMIERKSCKVDNSVYNLSCHDESCWYSGKIEEKYSWWSRNWVSTYRCGFR